VYTYTNEEPLVTRVVHTHLPAEHAIAVLLSPSAVKSIALVKQE